MLMFISHGCKRNLQPMNRLMLNVGQETDCVRIDWECSLDGNRIDAESRQDIDIELGVGLYTKLGRRYWMEIGDTNNVDIEFPQDHNVAELAGKSATYEITLHAITEKNLPPLDDEFAKDLGYENYSQLYGLIWNNLVEEETSLHVDKQKAECWSNSSKKPKLPSQSP